MQVTKTLIKQVNNALERNDRTEIIFRMYRKGTKVSYSYVNHVINSSGTMPNAITDTVRMILTTAQEIIKERENG
jgi:hypothetical protein